MIVEMNFKLPKLVSKILPFDTPVQVLILSVLVAVVVVFVYRSVFHTKEGFGDLYNRQNAFTMSQRPLFNEQMNKEVAYNSDLVNDMSRFKDAVRGVDPGINIVQTNNLDKYFQRDPLPGIRAAEQQCNVQEPSLLPSRKNNSLGCGWWYQDDDNKASQGARGTDIGPLDAELEKRSPGGEWIWDLQLAQKKEDEKRCRRVKTCNLADMVPRKCGFCLDSSMGVPIDEYSRSKYPNDPRLGCSNLITKPGNCPPPPAPPPVTNPDGTVTVPAAPRDVCSPVQGKLSIECLISLATGAGCQEEGAILDILRGDSMTYYRGRTDANFKFKKALEIIKTDGRVNSNNAFFGDGVCDRTEALTYYTKVVALTRSGPTTRSRQASGFLVSGTDFDPCEYDPQQNGPFELMCQQRVAREKGCQPAGSSFPSNANKNIYDNMSWSKFNQHFSNLYSQMTSNDKDIQADSTKKCLGVTITQPPADCGDLNGCEVLWYAWQYEWDFPEKAASRATFYGRQILATLPNFNTGGPDFNPYGRSDVMAMRIRTRLTSPTTQTATMWVMTDDGVAVKADNRMVLRSFWDQGPTAYTTTRFNLIENKPTNLDVYWYENYGGATFIPRIQIGNSGFNAFSEKMLTMRAPSGFPIARWDFYMGTLDDRNGVLTTVRHGNIPFEVIDGKKCAVFRGAMNYLQIANPISTTAFRSITMMVFMRNNPPSYPRLWEMNTNGFSGSWCQDSLFGCLSPNNSNGIGFYAKRGCGGPEIWSGNGSFSSRRWTHISWVIDEDMKGMTIYIDSTRVARVRDDNFNLLQNKIYNNFYIFQSVERFDKDAGVAWMHMFDYPLSAADVKMDMGLGFSDPKVYPEDPNSGWKNRFTA